MKISIITPVYNAVDTISRTILSVIEQPINSELEYIIIDGGSTDGTQDVIKQYKNNIHLFITEKDKGVYDAMNKGIKHATGDIIGIINADDWYNEKALNIVEAVFSKDPSIDIAYSPIDNYLKGNYFNRFIPGSLENLYIKFILNHPSCFVKQSVYSSLGGYSLDFKIASDYEFFLRAYVSGFNFHYVDTTLASYSLDGMSGLEAPFSLKLRQIDECQKISDTYISKAKNPSLAERQRKFYRQSKLKLYITYPFKKAKILTPNRTNKVKQYLRSKIGALRADSYGSW